ncbi:MAG: hypothetical protein ABGW69_00770 [Nanoarchaeota archaeon]
MKKTSRVYPLPYSLIKTAEIVAGSDFSAQRVFEYNLTPGEITAIALTPNVSKNLEGIIKFFKETNPNLNPLFLFAYIGDNSLKENIKKSLEIVNKYFSDSPAFILKYKEKRKIEGIPDLVGTEVVEKVGNPYKADSVIISTINKDPSRNDYQEQGILVPVLERLTGFYYGKEGDNEKSIGVQSKLGYYLVDNNHLPEGIIYNPSLSKNMEEDFHKIEEILGEGIKFIKPAISNVAGGFAVKAYKSKDRFKNLTNKLSQFLAEKGVNPLLLIQKAEVPFIAQDKNNNTYTFFVRVHPYLDEMDELKYLVLMKYSTKPFEADSWDEAKQEYLNLFAKNKAEINLSSGVTGAHLFLYDPKRKEIKNLGNFSKNPKYIPDFDSSYLLTPQGKVKLYEGLAGLLDNSLVVLQDFDDRLNELAYEFSKNPELYEQKIRNIEENLRKRTHPILSTKDLKSI